MLKNIVNNKEFIENTIIVEITGLIKLTKEKTFKIILKKIFTNFVNLRFFINKIL